MIRRCFAAIAVALLALATGGCAFLLADQIHYSYAGEPVTNWCPAPSSDPTSSRNMIGVALSGGGSRAAVFGAAAWEALAEHGLLEDITHLSTVSGGSMAGAYIGANPPPCGEPTSAACRAYFTTFKRIMREDLTRRTQWRELNPGRTLSSTRRATSLKESLDEVFLADRVFGEVAARPILFINASSYDDRRRFVFTRERLPRCSEEEGICPCGFENALLTEPGLRALSFPAGVPDNFPLSLAVATSAAFPPLFGPMAFEVASPGSGEPCQTPSLAGRECEWWHLGDGGIIDNTGVETLEEVALLQAEVGGLESVQIISLDAGWLWESAAMKERSNLEMWTEDPGRVVDTAKRRGVSYHDILWEQLRGTITNARGEAVHVDRIEMHYLDGEEDALPVSCDAEAPEDIGSLEDIPTSLSISNCHADRLERAAHKIVHAALNGTFTHSPALRAHPDPATGRATCVFGFAVARGGDR
jgi:predicted acylesterase/phospholipase RssA